MFHGGKFTKVGDKLIYQRRKFRTFRIDPDELSWWDLQDRAKECGDYSHIESIHYLVGLGFDSGLRRVYNDDEVREIRRLIMDTNLRCLDLFVVEGNGDSLPPPNVETSHSPNAKSILSSQKSERPAKLTPRRASNVPLRKSLRATSKSISVELTNTLFEPTNTLLEPTNKNKPKKKPNNGLPEVIFMGSNDSTTTLLNKNPKHTPLHKEIQQAAVNIEPHQSQQLTTVTTNAVLKNYEWEDPRLESPISFADLLGNYSNDEDTDSEYEPGSESSEEEETDTSDEEYAIARERVRGCNARLLEIAQQLQRDASEGKMGTQHREEPLNTLRSEQVDEHASDYELSDEEIHTPLDSGEDETLEQRISNKSLIVSLDTDFTVFKWKVGQRFATRSDFKKAVAKYGIYQGRNVSIKISNKSRQQRIGVSKRRTYLPEKHEKNKQLKCTWLAEQLLDGFKARPHWPGADIVETVRRGFKVVISVDFAYKVKHIAHQMLHGSMKDHYVKVGKYIAALNKCSPRTHIALISTMKDDQPPQIFQRLFVSFEGLQKGWKEGCRKIICVDACFLKTFLGGQLSSAVGRDDNDQMYPIAWAVVEGENNLSWEWFFLQLQMCLNLDQGDGLVIVSDEHMAIINGVGSVFPNAKHRHCARHVFALWHRSFRGDEMKLAFWNIVKAYNMVDYIDALKDLTEKNPNCCHSIQSLQSRTIFFCQQQPEDYVDQCFKKATYLKAYTVSIPPMEGERYWPDSDLHLDPPPIKIGPGRPRKNRRKDPFEDPKRPGRLTKHGMEMTCGCGSVRGVGRGRSINGGDDSAAVRGRSRGRGGGIDGGGGIGNTRGRGRGGRGRGGSNMPVGMGVIVAEDGGAFTNVPGGSGPRSVTDSVITTFGANFSQGST
ncbi:Transposase for insertion sequence element ISRM5 [Bienertia sinuspersici]